MGGIIDSPLTTDGKMGWAGTYPQYPAQPQRCPACGACLHCGHAAQPQVPWYPYIGDWPQPSYPSGTWIGGNVQGGIPNIKTYY